MCLMNTTCYRIKSIQTFNKTSRSSYKRSSLHPSIWCFLLWFSRVSSNCIPLWRVHLHVMKTKIIICQTWNHLWARPSSVVEEEGTFGKKYRFSSWNRGYIVSWLWSCVWWWSNRNSTASVVHRPSFGNIELKQIKVCNMYQHIHNDSLLGYSIFILVQ